MWIINLPNNKMFTAERRNASIKLALLLLYKKLRLKRSGRRPDTNSSLSEDNTWMKFCRAILHIVGKSFGWINAFIAFFMHFRSKGWLKNSHYILFKEKMAVFLFTLSHNMWNRVFKCIFNRSLQTIHFYFHEFLQAMLKLSKEMVVPLVYEQNLNSIQNHQELR